MGPNKSDINILLFVIVIGKMSVPPSCEHVELGTIYTPDSHGVQHSRVPEIQTRVLYFTQGGVIVTHRYQQTAAVCMSFGAFEVQVVGI